MPGQTGSSVESSPDNNALYIAVLNIKRIEKMDTRKITEMRNLGPACAKDLNAAGIFTAEDLKKLGVKEAFKRMLAARAEQGRSAKCCNALYLYSLHGAIHDIDWRALPEEKKNEYKEFTARLRATGKF